MALNRAATTMFLCDLITSAAAHAGQPTRLGVPPRLAQQPLLRAQLRAASRLAAAVGAGGVPRHVLSGEVVAAATQAVLSAPSSVLACVHALRVPWKLAWFEWEEPSRVAVHREYGVSRDNGHQTPSRMGFLVEASEDGRSGTVSFAWAHAEPRELSRIPNVNPVRIAFDLDRLSGLPLARPPGAGRRDTPIYRRYAANPAETEALDGLAALFWHEAGEEARLAAAAAAASAGGDPRVAADYMRNVEEDLRDEQLFFAAVIMLLTARNGTVSEPGEDRSRLNKARQRKGEPAFLSHVVTYLRLSKGEASRGGRLGDDMQGGPARRAHMVRGHLVVRSGEGGKPTIYWRRAHARGLAGGVPMARRTVKVGA